MSQRNMHKKTIKRKRRPHSPEYKAEVVRLVRESGKSPEVVGREMGLSGSLIRSWMRQSTVDKRGGGTGALTTEEREELNTLRREVRTLRQERDILKRATAFFVKEATS
jgi:transposase